MGSTVGLRGEKRWSNFRFQGIKGRINDVKMENAERNKCYKYDFKIFTEKYSTT